MKKQLVSLCAVGTLLATTITAHGAALLGGSGYCEGLGCIFFPLVVCAPEVKDGNVAAVERVVAEVSRRPDFSGAQKLKSESARIAALGNADEKIASYFQLVGVDIQDNQKVVEFLGARDLNGPWVGALQANLSLTRAQAEVLASSVRTALVGDLH